MTASDAGEPLLAFLRPLLEDGRVVLSPATRGPGPPRSAAVTELLAYVARMESLDLAGPPIGFDAEVALGAAEVLRRACWAVFDRSAPFEAIEPQLRMPHPPGTPEHHFAADLLFRYLPQLHRRIRAMTPDDPLADWLTGLLAEWPLSGVIGGFEPGPRRPPDLGEHRGLWELYAERYLAHEHPAWMPPAAGQPYLELARSARARARRPQIAVGGAHG